MSVSSAVRSAPCWRVLAEEQDGVVARRQARLGGMSEDQWKWRLDSGRWQSVLPGVAVVHSGPLTARQLAWAAVLCSGSGAALSGDAALVELGMRFPTVPSVLHVAVPEWRTVAARELANGAARVEPRRVRRLEDHLQPARRLPTLRVAPAVLHAAAWAGSDRAAEWRIAAAVQQRLVLPSDVHRSLATLPKLRRRSLISTVLRDVEHGAHAAGELDFLRFLRRNRLPPPDHLQRPVRTGRLRYLDAWWERQRLGVELDGAHHRTVQAWNEDVLRSNDLMVAGRRERVLLLRYTTSNLRHDGARVAAQLAAALR